MGNIAVNYNNPLNLTVTGPNSYLYAGQSGVYSSPNGFNYAEFPNSYAGTSAGQQYISDNIGTDPNTSLSTVNQFLGYFLNGSYNGVQNTAANPNAVNYASRVAQSLGIGLNDNFTSDEVNSPSFINSLGAAVAVQEGGSSVYTPSNGGVASTSGSLMSGVNNTIDYLDSYINNAIPSIGNWFNSNGGDTTAGANSAASLSGAAAGAQAQQNGLFAPLINWFNGLISGFEQGTQGVLVRGGFITVGIILLIAGIFYIVASNKQVQQVVTAAAA